MGLSLSRLQLKHLNNIINNNFKIYSKMQIIIETKTKQVKNPNTKTTYLNGDISKSLLTPKQYNLTTNNDTLSWFRRIGGTETAQRSYTSEGYVITKLTSIRPDRQKKTIRQFELYCLGYKESEVYKNLFKEYKDGLFYLKRFKSGKTFAEVQIIINGKLTK